MEEETIDHLFFKCQFFLAIYQESLIVIDILNGMQPRQTVQHWLLHPDQGVMLNLDACIMWNMWKCRNDLIFTNIHVSNSQCIQRALQDFILFDLHQAFNYSSNIDINHSNAVLREFTPASVIKVNVDASFNSGNALAAVVAIDSFGNHLGSGSFCFNCISFTVAGDKAYGLGI
ncbi:uncharacterized protein LOC113279276 [Papaver somniferum]|uniref:uncharacterized protein LOC113279276 n=1 Tax=Papaver somniferum TaxID=3469 RepID=UPI000E6FFFC2|nr:uncharacterized protein LOC113279276 [Papaver somniferum]